MADPTPTREQVEAMLAETPEGLGKYEDSIRAICRSWQAIEAENRALKEALEKSVCGECRGSGCQHHDGACDASDHPNGERPEAANCPTCGGAGHVRAR